MVGVSIEEPESGEFVSQGDKLIAEVEAKKISRIELIINGKVVETEEGEWEGTHRHIFELEVKEMKTQNMVTVKGFSKDGKEGEMTIILYK